MKGNQLWIALVGLLGVALAGQELWHRHRDGTLGGSGATEASKASTAVRELPKTWLTEQQMKAVKDFAGLTATQRYAVLQVMNERACDCGCPHGSVAKCIVDDPECPRAPVILKKSIELARLGKEADEIMDGIKKPGPVAGAPSTVAQQGVAQRVDVPDWSPSLGPPFAKVTIVEFSDFQCPFCTRVLPHLQKVREKYPNDVRIVFRNEPMQSHPNALPAAEAAMAAHAQGKFWRMHDVLFTNQSMLDRAHLEQFAAEIGLDARRFKADLGGDKYAKEIEIDRQAGMSLGINGTPALFINGRTILGAQAYETILGITEEELKKADALLARGVPLEQLYATVMAAIPPRQ